jgi:hypothetical protein
MSQLLSQIEREYVEFYAEKNVGVWKTIFTVLILMTETRHYFILQLNGTN